MGTYGPPVDQLLRLEDDLWERPQRTIDYASLGIGPEHIPDLIRMAVDPDLYDLDTDGPEGWAPAHAWRALGDLRAEEAIPPLVEFLATRVENDTNDLMMVELPGVFAKIGLASLPPLTELFEREAAGEYVRGNAAAMLAEIAKQHPEARAGVVASFARVLEDAGRYSPDFNGFLVADLLDLDAKEAGGVIERAYAGGFVDAWISGDWYDVWEQLGLEGEPPPLPEPIDLDLDPDPDDERFEDFDDGPDEVPSSGAPGWQPIEQKSPEERKDRNKVRQKLEKKAKRKKKGGKR